MSDEEVLALQEEDTVKPAKKERKRAPGAFAAFESKYHIVGNVLVLLVCVALIAVCVFSNATFGIYTLSDNSQAKVSQNMLQMGTAFTVFGMSDQELINYTSAADELIYGELSAAGVDMSNTSAVRDALEEAMEKHTEINYAKYVLANAFLNLKRATNKLSVPVEETPPQEGEQAEESTPVDTVQVYVTFGLTVLGVGAVLPIGLAVLSLAILVLKGLFILIFCRNGKSLHIAFPLLSMFTILALLMLQLGAVGEPGIFLYMLFGAAFAGMIIVGVVRYAAYPNKFIGKGLLRYMLMDVAFISAFSLSLTNPLTATLESGATVSMSVGQLVASGIFTANIPAQFDLQLWLVPLGVAAAMIFATLIMGCIMASKTYVVCDRWRKRQWKARNELTTISAILLTGFAAAFAWMYSYLCNTYLTLGLTFTVSLPMFIAPAVLVMLLILLLIIRPTKKVKKVVTEDIDE